jgi:hypothetical protein
VDHDDIIQGEDPDQLPEGAPVCLTTTLTGAMAAFARESEA